jgi:hypothetical protein
MSFALILSTMANMLEGFRDKKSATMVIIKKGKYYFLLDCTFILRQYIAET